MFIFEMPLLLSLLTFYIHTCIVHTAERHVIQKSEWNGMVFYGTSAQEGYFLLKTVKGLIDLGVMALQQSQPRCKMEKSN